MDHRDGRTQEPAETLDLGPHAQRARRSLNGDDPGETGTVLPPFIDHHVHLELFEPDHLAAGGIAAVVDLGANPSVVARFAARDPLPHVRFAGRFLTAPGGYPAGRSWLPAGALREVQSVPEGPAHAHGSLYDDAETAVDEQVRFGASVIKVALHAGGPAFDRATLDAVVRAAHARSRPVAVHAEGRGMAELAIDAGADALVHTPWTDELPPALVARAARAGQVWISTLDIHGHGAANAGAARARANLTRFAGAGGRVVYGTDLGNGVLPIGVNAREVAALVSAGLPAAAIVGALTDPWPHADRAAWSMDSLATFVPGPPPTRLDELGAWLAAARVLPADGLDPLDD
ncbi:amidohydrolase family protein [Agromyces aerolatus]|uniref:amidohydrolase family protein n=1 Tax=Agromyces sp. LY-1074 TaxID=3074080 RepID=UPI002857E273|nr:MULTISPECIES: hypothetical protein [unclassified Agromyces]MDR5698742.1 hypothetical protein [Agromyces sp. LY-1074]MDR5705036.1 hypothetical protein [Agromyces sp. LY-1358]